MDQENHKGGARGVRAKRHLCGFLDTFPETRSIDPVSIMNPSIDPLSIMYPYPLSCLDYASIQNLSGPGPSPDGPGPGPGQTTRHVFFPPP